MLRGAVVAKVFYLSKYLIHLMSLFYRKRTFSYSQSLRQSSPWKSLFVRKQKSIPSCTNHDPNSQHRATPICHIPRIRMAHRYHLGNHLPVLVYHFLHRSWMFRLSAPSRRLLWNNCRGSVREVSLVARCLRLCLHLRFDPSLNKKIKNKKIKN